MHLKRSVFVQPAIFLDRDETLTVDKGYTYKVSEFQWKAGAPEALKLFKEAGLPLFIVTNQGGIALGYFTEADMHAFHAHLQTEAAKFDVAFTDIAFCPHHPDAKDSSKDGPCTCRKPEPGLLFALAEKWDIDLSSSVMIGDRQSDIGVGQNAGCAAYFDCDFEAGRPTIADQAAYIIQKHFPDRMTP